MRTYNEELIRDVRRDFAQKQRLQHSVARFRCCGFDAEETDKIEEMSAKEYAEKVLRKLGLISPRDPAPRDPIASLDSYLAGKQHAAEAAARSRAQDSASDGRWRNSSGLAMDGVVTDNFITRQIGTSTNRSSQRPFRVTRSP